jgi:hypothetical protein
MLQDDHASGEHDEYSVQVQSPLLFELIGNWHDQHLMTPSTFHHVIHVSCSTGAIFRNMKQPRRIDRSSCYACRTGLRRGYIKVAFTLALVTPRHFGITQPTANSHFHISDVADRGARRSSANTISTHQETQQRAPQTQPTIDKMLNLRRTTSSIRADISLDLGCSNDEKCTPPALALPEEDDSVFLMLEGGMFGVKEETSHSRKVAPSSLIPLLQTEPQTPAAS